MVNPLLTRCREAPFSMTFSSEGHMDGSYSATGQQHRKPTYSLARSDRQVNSPLG